MCIFRKLKNLNGEVVVETKVRNHKYLSKIIGVVGLATLWGAPVAAEEGGGVSYVEEVVVTAQ